MAKLSLEISMSLDGFVAGPNADLDEPLGEGGELLHEWAFAAAAWQESHGHEGGAANADSEIIEKRLASVGATIMGKRMFGPGDGPWGDDPWKGWWGDEPPFGHPVFVLTHHAREPLALGATTFTFVTEGIESARDQALEAAGDDKDVAVAGGADVAQQYLRAGLLDELQIHVAPVLLGAGTRLFGDLGGEQVGLECTRVVESPAVTHLSYRPAP